MIDIALTDSLDLIFAAGDIVTAECTNQDIQLILFSQKGDWKSSVLTGVGIENYLLSSGDARELEAAIKLQLEADEKQITNLVTALNPLKITVECSQ